MLQGTAKMIRRRGFDCQTCPKVPQETREQLVPLGIKFGPEKALDMGPAISLFIAYHEAQAGAPYPTDPFQSRLYGMIHYILWQDQHQAQRATAKTPFLLRALLEQG